MEPLGRPVCFDCRNPAVNCTCKLSSGRELLVQLVYRSEPADRNEGLNLWATYLERHPATHNVDAKRFITDFKKHGFFQALDQEADNFRSMVLDYAAADFPPMGSAEIPDRNKAATDALSLFLSCRWSRMNNFEVMLIHNALGCLYREDVKLTPTLQLIWDALQVMLEFLGRISLTKTYSLETYPPVYRNSFKQKVYSLDQPPAKASYNGLSLSAYEALMSNLMKNEMYEASLVATICIQTNVSIEEVLTWKASDIQHGDQERCQYITVKQSASRVGAQRDVIVLRLPNLNLCPVSLMAMMSVARTCGKDLVTLMRSRQAANMYLIHDPDSLTKPLTPNNIKRQLVQGLAKINIKVELYEVQSLLGATYTCCAVKTYNTKEGRRCEMCKLPAPLKCGKCREVSYCSKECQAKDWKAGHKQVCGL